MKRLLLFSAFILFILSPILSFSQTYKIDEMRIYSWDGAPDWALETTTKYTYGNEGHKETKLELFNFPSTEALFQNNKTYNGSNNITLNVSQFRSSGSMPWQNTAQVTYDYNGSGNLMSETTQTYNAMSWQNAYQIEYEYDGSNNIIRRTTLYYNPGTMMFEINFSSTQELYEYSGTDITKFTIQSGGAGVFNNVEQYEYTYNAPGQPATEIESVWASGVWQPKEKSVATYTSGLRTLLEVYKYISGAWATEPFDQYITTYSGTLETEYLWQSWNGATWENNDRELSSYDGNGNKTVYIEEIWDAGIPDWVPESKVEIDYSVATPFSLSAESFNKEIFKVFPNPASDIINITSSVPFEKVELFDVLGKKVLSSYAIKPLNVENLKSGMYVLKIFNNNQTATKRVIIK